MKRQGRFFVLALLASFLPIHTSAQADPCGMVPPVYTGGGDPIKRVGPQKTYVFYRKGVESFVIRPGFSGKVDNFGMLIPFPSPPAIRKVPDHIFSHISAAIDPPEVIVRLWRRRHRRYRKMSIKLSPAQPTEKKLAVDAVKVLKQEAVGMYEVAVLQAGSPKALKGWMARHSYKYPKGMDKVTLDYIKAKWCFVAVKARVAGKKSVTPRPGMRSAKAKFPKGGSFTGNVQAMGFRFRTKRLVVPMRLSAFNKGRLRNIVYLLTTGPRRIRSIPKRYVMRQLRGRQLYDNVTKLLPIRVLGGTVAKIPNYRWPSIQRRRNPVPKNGLARDLFAGDLMSSQIGKLSLPHEERKKMLLRIGERLGLRGKHLDRLHRQAIRDQTEQTTKKSLHLLKRMTLTVVDGDFPREVIAKKNLTFAYYKMPPANNDSTSYNARRLGPGSRGRGVVSRYAGPKKYRVKPKQSIAQKAPPRRKIKRRRARFFYKLIDQMQDAKKVNEAVQKIVRAGKQSIPFLWGEVVEGVDLVRRGWSIVALTELWNSKLNKQVTALHQDRKQPILVRTWGAAARIQQTKTINDLIALRSLGYRFPPTKRPIRKRLLALLPPLRSLNTKKMLSMTSKFPMLRKRFSRMILKKPPKDLVHVMLTAKDNKTRRLAAGYIAAMAPRRWPRWRRWRRPKPIVKKNSKKERALLRKARKVGDAIADGVSFTKGAKKTPWDGGALFVPSIDWQKPQAKRLVGQLIRWYVWAELHKNTGLQQQIHNNIRSLSLARAAGYRSPGWRRAGISTWLRIWKQAAGCREVKQILRQQWVSQSPSSSQLLERLGCR
ncbi:MAG: hypothetical protein CL920_10465 [Deltaproteobacteria bacterium]|nr:hypothetical protein [Deltaproteobacteria bacterium]MBU49108.1 hypothetical protein [Deltaproteobacteria bacterium]